MSTRQLTKFRKLLIFLVLVSLFLVQSTWSQPISLGTSGGNINDISRLYCCSGTLGALVRDNNNVQYILSNNHVLARTNKGVIGDDIISPGLIDQERVCFQDSADAVADLSKFVRISFKSGTPNRVDAAIAAIRSGEVDSSGFIIGIGEVSSSTMPPSLGMAVQKSGRTTGLSKGMITAIAVTVKVTYNKTCGIGSQTATFTGQIMIGLAGFSAGGDSGSLIVEDCSSSPRAVGLLFAGSDTATIANPISEVLSSTGVSMVGTDGFCFLSATAAGGFSTKVQSQLPSHADQRAVEAVSKIKERNEKAILAIEGVVGMGVGLSETEPDQPVIEVYVKKPEHDMKNVLPKILEGIPVRIVDTGEIVAF